ncbi:MAG: nuclear transport factor 2 family protein [Bacteroidetes bacterium]|nr:nuclear transport factor 2 family protein [Bacteroidota bacterium]
MRKKPILIFFISLFSTVQFLIAQPIKKDNDKKNDIAVLSKLNAQFIKNFIAQDTVAHNQIIHKDFVCIEGNGHVFERNEYMKAWAHDYQNGGFTSFAYTDEVIRIFDNMALVRSKTVYTRVNNGVTTQGKGVYTDTYIKENGRWWCVQAHITPISQ